MSVPRSDDIVPGSFFLSTLLMPCLPSAFVLTPLNVAPDSMILEAICITRCEIRHGIAQVLPPKDFPFGKSPVGLATLLCLPHLPPRHDQDERFSL